MRYLILLFFLISCGEEATIEIRNLASNQPNSSSSSSEEVCSTIGEAQVDLNDPLKIIYFVDDDDKNFVINVTDQLSSTYNSTDTSNMKIRLSHDTSNIGSCLGIADTNALECYVTLDDAGNSQSADLFNEANNQENSEYVIQVDSDDDGTYEANYTINTSDIVVEYQYSIMNPYFFESNQDITVEEIFAIANGVISETTPLDINDPNIEIEIPDDYGSVSKSCSSYTISENLPSLCAAQSINSHINSSGYLNVIDYRNSQQSTQIPRNVSGKDFGIFIKRKGPSNQKLKVDISIIVANKPTSGWNFASTSCDIATLDGNTIKINMSAFNGVTDASYTSLSEFEPVNMSFWGTAGSSDSYSEEFSDTKGNVSCSYEGSNYICTFVPVGDHASSAFPGSSAINSTFSGGNYDIGLSTSDGSVYLYHNNF